MPDKNRNAAESNDGFLKLIPRSDTPTKSKINAAELSQSSKPKVKKEKKKNIKKKVKLLYWCYDDRHTVGCVLKGKNVEDKIKFSNPDLFVAEDIKDKIGKVKKTGKAKEEKALDLPIGTEYLYKSSSNLNKISEMLFQSSLDSSLDISDFQEFKKLTSESGSQSERLSALRIICVILSSYIFRPMLNIPEILETYRLNKKELRAFHANVSKGENAFYTLKQICQSMIVCTSAREDGNFQLTAPTIISPATELPILDVAHLDVCQYKGYHWPAPYRDTSVLLDARNLKTKDMASFAKLNPWCSCIIYGKKQDEASIFGYGEDVKGEALTDILPELNTDVIQNLIKTYVINIPILFRDKTKEFITTWIQSGTYLEKHITKHKSNKWKDSVKFKSRVEVTALISFLNFVKEKCAVSEDDLADFRDPLLDVLLPGCLTEKPADVASTQSRSPQKIFDEVLQKLLTEENLKHIFPLPDKNGAVWPLEVEQDNLIWGYIKYHRWQKNDLEKSACLILPREQLLQVVKSSIPDADAFTDVLASFQKERPTYMHTTMNAKIKHEGEVKATPRTAYRLKIVELPIDESIKEKLLEMSI